MQLVWYINRPTNFSFRVASPRRDFFTYRAAKIWNDLPADNTHFSSLNSLNAQVLV